MAWMELSLSLIERTRQSVHSCKIEAYVARQLHRYLFIGVNILHYDVMELVMEENCVGTLAKCNSISYLNCNI